jgi:excinuclease ABC subunit B
MEKLFYMVKNLDEIKSSTIVADKEIGEIIELEQKMELDDLDTLELKDKVKEIERKMLNYAKELQFEKAALLRNQLEKIKKNIPGDGDV